MGNKAIIITTESNLVVEKIRILGLDRWFHMGNKGPSNLRSIMEEDFLILNELLKKEKIQESPNLFTIYKSVNPSGDHDVNFINGVIIDENAIIEENIIKEYSVYICDLVVQGRFVKGVFNGNYDNISQAWIGMDSYIKEHSLRRNGYLNPWEVAINFGKKDTSESITEIYIPIIS